MRAGRGEEESIFRYSYICTYSHLGQVHLPKDTPFASCGVRAQGVSLSWYGCKQTKKFIYWLVYLYRLLQYVWYICIAKLVAPEDLLLLCSGRRSMLHYTGSNPELAAILTDQELDFNGPLTKSV